MATGVEPAHITAGFERLGIILEPSDAADERVGVFNPASARLRDGTLQLYPRMAAPGNISSIGSFRITERPDGTVRAESCGFALQPTASYELRVHPGGYGCEDPRVTFIAAIDHYVMAYVAFGPRGPEVALAVSHDGRSWKRLGLMHFPASDAPFADKDAAFFPEPVRSPSGVPSLAFYHRPTLRHGSPEGISMGYVPLSAVTRSMHNLCTVVETHHLLLPPATWGSIKVGGGAPPVRIREGWLSIIHGVDPLHVGGAAQLRYCAGIIIHDAESVDRVIFRSESPLIVPAIPGELYGAVRQVVFPTAIDPRGDRVFDIYYGMADYEIGRGRLTLRP